MTDFIVAYFWHVLAVCIAPLAGFAWAQWYKISGTPKPVALKVAIFNGAISAIFSFLLWPGDFAEKAKIGLLIGSVCPFIIAAWFLVVKKFAPDQASSLTGSGDDYTIVPGFKINLKDEDKTQPRD